MKTNLILESPHSQKLRTLFLIGVMSAFLVIIILVSPSLPGGSDWYEIFRPATQALVSGQSPYSQDMFFMPVWALAPFVPLMALTPTVGRAILFIVALAVYMLSARRLGAGPVALIAFLLSPPVVMSLWLGSLDWLPLLGLTLPPTLGLFLILVKPQLGGLIALYWLIAAWGKGGWREVIRVFLPVTLAFLLTLIIYGPWPFRVRSLMSIEHNVSLWPVSLPIGLVLLVAMVRYRQPRYAIAASPCLSPYLMMTSWSGVLATLLPHTSELIAAVVGLWVLIVLSA